MFVRGRESGGRSQSKERLRYDCFVELGALPRDLADMTADFVDDILGLFGREGMQVSAKLIKVFFDH
jgi:hypothetical protein